MLKWGWPGCSRERLLFHTQRRFFPHLATTTASLFSFTTDAAAVDGAADACVSCNVDDDKSLASSAVRRRKRQ